MIEGLMVCDLLKALEQDTLSSAYSTGSTQEDMKSSLHVTEQLLSGM